MKNDFAGGNKLIKKPKPVLVALLGPGEIFGDYEAFLSKETHEFTLMCHNVQGEILIIERSEFLKKVSSLVAIH